MKSRYIISDVEGTIYYKYLSDSENYAYYKDGTKEKFKYSSREWDVYLRNGRGKEVTKEELALII